MKVVIFARVSTANQHYQRQINELQAFCDTQGWVVDKVFANKISGAKKAEERPEIVEMIQYIKTHQVDKVVVLEISRLGRNTLEALKVIQMLTEEGISLYVKNYNLETIVEGKINPMASFLTTILLEVANWERLTIIERCTSGRNQYIAKCRATGKKMGRPETYRKADEAYKEQYAKDISLLKKGISLRNIHSITGTSIVTLRKIKAKFV